MAGIPGLIAGIGFKALAGRTLGNAFSGLKAVGKWIGGLDVIHLLALALAILLFVDHVGLVIAHRHSAKVEKQLTAANTALGRYRTALATSTANEAKLRQAIATQNASIAALGQKSAQAQNAATIARKAAEERANEAERTAEALRQSAASTGLKTAPSCEPSDQLKKQWPS